MLLLVEDDDLWTFVGTFREPLNGGAPSMVLANVEVEVLQFG